MAKSPGLFCRGPLLGDFLRSESRSKSLYHRPTTDAHERVREPNKGKREEANFNTNSGSNTVFPFLLRRQKAASRVTHFSLVRAFTSVGDETRL